MIVHSFSPHRTWFGAFARFVSLLGCTAEPDRLIPVRPDAPRPLYLGWSCGDLQSLTTGEADRQGLDQSDLRSPTSG
jgi:hypothetical protein